MSVPALLEHESRLPQVLSQRVASFPAVHAPATSDEPTQVSPPLSVSLVAKSLSHVEDVKKGVRLARGSVTVGAVPSTTRLKEAARHCTDLGRRLNSAPTAVVYFELAPSRRSQKRKGLPELGEQLTASSGAEMHGSDVELQEPPKTPYRLPRLTARDDGDNKIHWAGYRSDTAPPPELRIQSERVPITPKHHLQQVRNSQMLVPKFYGAMIAPVFDSRASHFSKNYSDEQFYRSLVSRSKVTQTAEPDILRIASPLRNSSATKSISSIHWTLSPHRHTNFDRKGKLKSQGPFSRQLTVTCMAPHNWLKMTYGRSKTMA